MANSKLFSNEELDFVKNNVIGKTSKELTDLFNEKFKRNITYKQIRYLKKRYKWKSGIDTKFKTGQQPHNYKPVGSEFISSDGYIYIKVAEPNTWQHKGMYVYEQAYGKIPDDHSVMHLNKDKLDCRLENLVLIKDNDKLLAGCKRLIYSDTELTKTGILIAKLINRAIEKSKEKV